MSRRLAKLGGIGLLLLALLAALSLAPRARNAEATANPLPPLLGCSNVDASPDGKVTVADILMIVHHVGNSYGQSGYEYIWDPVMPYNDTSPAGTGKITVADILFVVHQFGQTCPAVDTQIAAATRATADPSFSSTLCDPAYKTPVNCGGDPRFLTEDAAFLATKGYVRGSKDVPGQGVHYINESYWDGVFNPARPDGLVYKGGVLLAQLYYAEGGDVGWGADSSHNVRAVNIDSLCTPVTGHPPGIGCSWAGGNDGWHWHSNLCTFAIGSPNAFTFPGPASQSACAADAAAAGVTCSFYPALNYNCDWRAQVGWMSHLWNWLPNANFTNAVNPGPGGLNDCTATYCAVGESNGRFADCAPEGGGWNAYNCPQ
jgi:hypothetical protein